MKPKKRYTTPVAKPGQLIVRWGKVDRHSEPSLVYAYPDRDGKSDSRVVMSAFEEERNMRTLLAPNGIKTLPSLLDELVSRGYDPETFRFSIEKKAQTPDAP